MKRTPLKRTSRLARRAPLRAKGRSRFPKVRDAAFCAWIRERPCVLRILCTGPVEAHHVRTRAAGGVDVGNVVPLCQRHHRQFHDYGRKTFEAMWHIDLKAEAVSLAATHDQEDAGR